MPTEQLTVEWLHAFFRVHRSITIQEFAGRLDMPIERAETLLANFARLYPMVIAFSKSARCYNALNRATTREPRTLVEAILRVEEDVRDGRMRYGDTEDYAIVLEAAKRVKGVL